MHLLSLFSLNQPFYEHKKNVPRTIILIILYSFSENVKLIRMFCVKRGNTLKTQCHNKGIGASKEMGDLT